MDHNMEYHDPDYPKAPVCVPEEPPRLTEEEKVEKIKSIISREFSNELEVRENEVMLIEQRMSASRRLLHRLRYALVNKYYADQKLQITNGQILDEISAQKDPKSRAEVASLLREGQRQIHPSVRKLLGKQAVDIDEIFRTRGPRNKTRKDYSAMLQKRNYTISADSTTKSLRPQPEPENSTTTPLPKKVPRHLEPKITNIVTLDEITRNKMKHRYRIIIGNTSKYVPASSSADRSTHKWLLYVRECPLLTAVTVTLHHSYCPHHVVHLSKPPYHISRRGWGEFPAKIELHFALPEVNRPACLEHMIKLDRNYTGMQMLGSETVVDVWLYSTPEMIQYEYKEQDNTLPPTNKQTDEQEVKPALPEIPPADDKTDDWMDFFTKTPTELDVDEMIIKPVKKEKIEEEPETTEVNDSIDNHLVVPNEIISQPTSIKKRIMKYIDPSTGKIYYLEMDRELDLSKVQEIVINNKSAKISPIKTNGLRNYRKRKSGGMSLLKPEIKNLLKSENEKKPFLSHIENDHCYLATPNKPCLESVAREIKSEKSLYDDICAVMPRFCTIRAAVNYLVKHIPLISGEVRDPDFLKHFPFVVENSKKYWKLDFAKRRNIEWSRAKLIQRLLIEHFTHSEPVWRTKQILMYVRLHGHYPVREEHSLVQTENNEWSTWNDLESLKQLEASIKETYPHSSDINTLTAFNFDVDKSASDVCELSDDEEVDILGTDVRIDVKKEPETETASLEVLPVENDEDRLRFLFIEKQCCDIGIELRNEDVGNGYSYSAVHAVLLSAVRSFAEELIRSGLTAKRTNDNTHTHVWTGSGSSISTVSVCDVYAGTRSPRLALLTSKDLATDNHQTYAI